MKCKKYSSQIHQLIFHSFLSVFLFNIVWQEVIDSERRESEREKERNVKKEEENGTIHVDNREMNYFEKLFSLKICWSVTCLASLSEIDEFPGV
jgi:hypothetical protein